MESKKDDSSLNARFLVVRKEIYYRYTEKQYTEQEASSVSLKRGMSECTRDSDIIETDTESPLRVQASRPTGQSRTD
jgi:hypothetical protein